MTFYTHDLAQFLEQNRYLKKFWWLNEQSRGNILLCKSPSELEPSCPSSPSPMPIPSIAPSVLLILVQSYHRVSFSSLAQKYNLFFKTLSLSHIFIWVCVWGGGSGHFKLKTNGTGVTVTDNSPSLQVEDTFN